mmetsp:Transcript_7057/g.21695  ORF Transcript_7057/g.21695 Transcript_7057/m.21695 type:complete len:113 (-) Transcript_7057:147-485(-)
MHPLAHRVRPHLGFCCSDAEWCCYVQTRMRAALAVRILHLFSSCMFSCNDASISCSKNIALALIVYISWFEHDVRALDLDRMLPSRLTASGSISSRLLPFALVACFSRTFAE